MDEACGRRSPKTTPFPSIQNSSLPPGRQALRDWASYLIPVEDLLEEPDPGMTPPALRAVLDWQHGEQGRIIHDCEPWPMLRSGLCK